MLGKLICLSLLLSATHAVAQIPARRPYIRATGDAVVSSRPDQVKVSVGVITQGATAQEATESNASQTAAVLAALRQLLGANADIRTVGFSVTPQYRFTTGQPPTLIGFQTTNTVEVTLNDLTLAGRVVDAAVAGGANNITSLRFTLKDPAPAQREALRLATIQARQHAEAIASNSLLLG